MVAALKRAVQLDADIRVRFAVAFYHAAVSAGDTEKSVGELRVEKEYLELLKLTVRMAPVYREAAAGDPQRLLDLIEGSRALHCCVQIGGFSLRRRCTLAGVGADARNSYAGVGNRRSNNSGCLAKARA